MELLKTLAEKGIHFVIEAPCEHGYQTTFLTPENVLRFIDDPLDVYAEMCGVAKANYLAWMDAGFSVSCAAITKRGKPCRNTVKGGHQISAKRWVEMQGEYCIVHGGD